MNGLVEREAVLYDNALNYEEFLNAVKTYNDRFSRHTATDWLHQPVLVSLLALYL